jgi:5'-nucleotidase/UDP-sugar diphosphatase
MKLALRLHTLLLLTIAGFSHPAIITAQLQQPEKIVILHWNDFHAQNISFLLRDSSNTSLHHEVGGAANLAGYIDSIRSHEKNVLTLDAGDDDQGTPISTITAGRSQVEITNIIHPTAAVLGNHEFDYGIDSLRRNINEAHYPILCSNVVSLIDNRTLGKLYLIDTIGNVVIGIIGNVVIGIIGNVVIGIIGVSPPDLFLLTMASNLRGYRIRDVDSSIDIALREIRSHTHPNLIILLSHMGLEQDTLLALRRNDINVIVGGHDHIALFTPLKKNRTLIVQAGSKGEYIGNLEILLDEDSIREYSGRLIETTVGRVHENSDVAAIVNGFEKTVDLELGKVIGTLMTPWRRNLTDKVEMNIGDFECDVMREATQTDVAFHNVGGLRKDLDSGTIRMRDIWEINPFGNTLVTFSVDGATLKRMIEWQTSVRTKEFTQVSGVRYSFNSSNPPGHRIQTIELDRKILSDSAVYSVCTNNYIGSHIRDFLVLAQFGRKINEIT